MLHTPSRIFGPQRAHVRGKLGRSPQRSSLPSLVFRSAPTNNTRGVPTVSAWFQLVRTLPESSRSLDLCTEASSCVLKPRPVNWKLVLCTEASSCVLKARPVY